MGASARVAVVVDDHSIVRSGIQRLLERLGVIRIEEADNGIDAIGLAKSLQPDLMLLDLALPHAGGLEVFAEVRRWSPNTRVVVFTGLTSSSLLTQLVKSGADGVFLKSDDAEELQAGLSAIMEGGRIVSRSVQGVVAEAPPTQGLTRRESEILELLLAGYNNTDIGQRLSISPNTVNNHRANLMSKLNVHSISELMALAMREGLLDEHRHL